MAGFGASLPLDAARPMKRLAYATFSDMGQVERRVDLSAGPSPDGHLVTSVQLCQGEPFVTCSETRLAQIYESHPQSSSFWTCPCAHAVFFGLSFADVTTALRVTVPRVALKLIVGA